MRGAQISGLDAARTIRPRRVAVGVVTGGFLLLIVGKFVRVLEEAIPDGRLAFDFRVYLDIARQWLDTGAMYAPFQLAGPYVSTIYLDGGVVNSYPPPVTLLFASFLYLPALLWWIVPLSLMTVMTIYWRPAAWSWPLIAGALAILPFAVSIAMGNTILWAMAAMALATRWPGAALGLAAKPILLPFALPVLRPHRSWLVFGAIGVVLALLVLPHWPDYVVASRNGVAGLGLWGTLFYYFPHQFLVLVPLLPWLARTRPGTRVSRGVVSTA